MKVGRGKNGRGKKTRETTEESCRRGERERRKGGGMRRAQRQGLSNIRKGNRETRQKRKGAREGGREGGLGIHNALIVVEGVEDGQWSKEK